MNTIEAIISSLENTPEILNSLLREIPEQNLKRSPREGKWSAHEHAVHIAEGHQLFFDRLNLMLSEENPPIKSWEPSSDDESGGLLKVDLDAALNRYATDRKALVEKLKSLAPEDWQRTARHEDYADYSIFIMFRHFTLHDALHAYRIEEVLQKKDWD